MPINKPCISLTEAQQIINAVLLKAGTDGGAPVAVTVVDISARLTAFASMDGVAAASIKLSQSKAYSAVVGQKDTINWASFPKNEKVVDFDMRNWTDANFSGFTGGVIITVNGAIIGGVGVSGRKGKMSDNDTLMQDNELATYGATAINLK